MLSWGFTLFYTLQGWVLGLLRPAQWLGWLNKNRCHVVWTVRGTSRHAGVRQVIRALRMCEAIEGGGWRITASGFDDQLSRGYFRAHWYSPYLKWLDVVEVTLHATGGGSHRGSAWCRFGKGERVIKQAA
jgi:hypothetical protein